jgi:hypothetical protein
MYIVNVPEQYVIGDPGKQQESNLGKPWGLVWGVATLKA